MDEVENSVNLEVALQETTSHEQAETQTQDVHKTESRQQENFRSLRERQRQLEFELKTQREMNEKLLNMATQATQKPQEVDEFDSMSDDEYIPKGKVKKLVSKEKDRIVKETVAEVEKMLHQREQSQFLDRLKRQYSDFNEVVNPETLSALEESDPELAQTISDLKDPYKIGLQSYKYIKAMNLSPKVDEMRRSKEIDKKLEKNAKTVQTPQAFDKRPLAQAFKMTDAEKNALYEEMMQAARGAGSGY